jgi:probable phosphoglycerate mutase
VTVVGLLRHGPTAWNLDKRIQGRRDIPLDREHFEVRPWRAVLDANGPWDRIVTSPLRRARETAQLLYPGRSPEMDDGLAEQDWGEWTASRIADIRRDFPGGIEAQEARGWDFTPPGGESRRHVLDRALGAICRAGAGDGQRILMVTHLGIIKIVLNHLLDTPFLPGQSASVAKRALHLLETSDRGTRILEINMRVP